MRKPTDAEKEQIRDEIFAKTERALKSAGFSRSKIAKELHRIAFSDIADYLQIDEQGSTKAISLDSLTPGASKAIKKIREKRKIMETKGGAGEIILEDTFEFELYDKLDALKTAASMLGMERPKEMKHSGEINLHGTLIEDLQAAKEKARCGNG